MPKKRNDVQIVEVEKKKLEEEIHKKLPTVKAKQDTINENLERLQEFRDNEPNPLGKGKQKNQAAVTAVHRSCDSQLVFTRNLTEYMYNIVEMDYRAQIASGELSRRDLMELIKLRGDLLPLWINFDSPFPGEYVGAIAPADGSKLNEHDSVAAFNKDGNWILADIVSCHTNSRYECRDVDDDKKKLTVFSRSHLIPLPKWKANPKTERHALFEKNAIVLALYPQTTCFYKGIVHSAPLEFREAYQIAFEDLSYASGFCPPMPVSQKYVIAFREVAGATASTAPRKNHKKK
ncbi:unnamed protein product [Caenorhabditis sp. 36 PRJEB53466]|nr:unnamed protein product [Caenorhabditis sp. 36 PRJEB53466]